MYWLNPLQVSHLGSLIRIFAFRSVASVRGFARQCTSKLLYSLALRSRRAGQSRHAVVPRQQ